VEASQGKDEVAARSPMFRWTGVDSPPAKGAILAAHEALVQRLHWDRWEFEGKGRNWWECSFRRPATFRQAHSGIRLVPAGRTEPSTRGEALATATPLPDSFVTADGDEIDLTAADLYDVEASDG
jgi:hypothetical protein